MAAIVARRSLLQAGALTGGLALTGLRPRSGVAAPVSIDRPPLSGSIGQHVRLDLAHGATIRMVQLDTTQRPVWEFGEVSMKLAELYDGGRPTSMGSPLQRVCGRAQSLALDLVAVDWDVPRHTCIMDHRGISHPASGRSIGYKAWVDII